jgi:hypothetical protein
MKLSSNPSAAKEKKKVLSLISSHGSSSSTITTTPAVTKVPLNMLPNVSLVEKPFPTVKQ